MSVKLHRFAPNSPRANQYNVYVTDKAKAAGFDQAGNNVPMTDLPEGLYTKIAAAAREQMTIHNFGPSRKVREVMDAIKKEVSPTTLKAIEESRFEANLGETGLFCQVDGIQWLLGNRASLAALLNVASLPTSQSVGQAAWAQQSTASVTSVATVADPVIESI